MSLPFSISASEVRFLETRRFRVAEVPTIFALSRIELEQALARSADRAGLLPASALREPGNRGES